MSLRGPSLGRVPQYGEITREQLNMLLAEVELLGRLSGTHPIQVRRDATGVHIFIGRLPIATPTVEGMVSTAEQHFAGRKYFEDLGPAGAITPTLGVSSPLYVVGGAGQDYGGEVSYTNAAGLRLATTDFLNYGGGAETHILDMHLGLAPVPTLYLTHLANGDNFVPAIVLESRDAGGGLIDSFTGQTTTVAGLDFTSGLLTGGSFTGGVSDGTYGDIIVSGGGTDYQIGPDAVGPSELDEDAVEGVHLDADAHVAIEAFSD